MYTQCPDCEIAFKVTADVLKQAAGKVRCGGCGNAFNALAFLSEQMPKQPVATTPDAQLPELTPEIIETDSGLPKAISAEQSAALLKTLDELAGSDIRIEDTGVEWRVLDEQDAAMPAAGDEDAGPAAMLDSVDEFLDDTPTPIDQFLTATPEVIDSPEIFEDAGPNKTYVDELRFDDNTPLPEDFDNADESRYVAQPQSSTAAVTEDELPEPFVEDVQADLALSEPDEWTDILDEFQDLVAEVSAPLEPAEEPAEEPEPSQEPEELVVETPADDQPMDMDSQFALQAEAMGIDLSGINEIADDLAFSESAVFEEELNTSLNDEEIDDAPIDEPEAELVEEAETPLDDEVEEELETESENEVELEDELEDKLEELPEIVVEDEEAEEALDDEPTELIDEPVIESHTIEDELAELEQSVDAADDLSDDTDDDSGNHYVAPMTEAEQTVNMQIDQDLMALAIEDEDGFASTIVIPEKDTEQKAREERPELSDDEAASDAESFVDDPSFDDDSGFETIIMEGEIVRSAMDKEKLAADVAAARELADLARNREAEKSAQSGGRRLGMITGVVILVLLFGIQVMHQSRESLATMPAFSNTVGQVYRALGQPVQPAWDVTGWRVEVSNDQIDVQEGEENLTVQSRIRNNTDQAMPYPLVNISLTDRFLEPVGSQLLDPVEYLAADLDPRKLVEPDNTFNAIITIKSPSIDASGYKVDICYRQTDEQLRCAMDDFK